VAVAPRPTAGLTLSGGDPQSGTYLYRPAPGFFMAVVTAVTRPQSGRLDACLLYLLIALIAIIAVATALA
jgi:hypothetical protein